MRKTFFTNGRDLFDPSGKKVLLRGVNKMSVWDEKDPAGESYFAEIRKTQANSVRIVWAIRKDLTLTGVETDLDTLDALITNARKHQLIPMIELHDATGQWERLPKLVDYWVLPEVVALIEKHQAYLFVNIGNEVGDDTVKQGQFTSGYKTAVKRMREAGIHTPLIIDAPEWGKNLDILNGAAKKLIEVDPDQNLIFSVHLFWPISAGADAAFISSKLETADGLGYPLLVGEFSKYGGFAGNDAAGKPRSICGEQGEIDYHTILKVCDEKHIGWYAWEWGPGNDVSDPLCAVMDMTPDGQFAHLKSGWATDVANSIKQASEKENYFTLPLPELSPLQTRIESLKAVLSVQKDQQALSEALEKSEGDWPKALANLTKNQALPAVTIQKLTLAHSLAVWSSDNVPIVKALSNGAGVASLRDVALRFNVEKLTELVDSRAVPENTVGTTAVEKKRNFAVSLQRELFIAEPTAVLHRMVQDAEVPILDKDIRIGVASFLSNQPEFNIRTTSVYNALQDPEAFKGIADEHRSAVVENLKTLQRVQAISPIPEAVPLLMEANLTSAFRVAEIPESTFLSAHRTTLGESTAKQIHTAAVNAHIRNEQALMTMRDATRGPGLAIMGGRQSMEMRMANAQAVVDEKGIPLNLETLFGSIDFCECGECLSIYSPAAYFVDILQYLRNNDLGPDPANPSSPSPGIRTDPKDISNTPLEKLFRRRPDLGCLELTCENTFTVLPYIDLVNEVMESFVVHLDKYEIDTHVPKQATLEVFNVDDETTSELLAQPQHINYEAYCILKNAVYPFTLPYHQPIDAIRIWLKQMRTSRYELLDTFRTANETCDYAALTYAQQQELLALHGLIQDRSVDAEFLGITQEEYIILTREAFWPKVYFDLTLQKVHTRDEYEQKIGVRKVHEYYGYETEADMLDVDETAKIGLTFVKKQFLPRTGIKYVDLVELLKTHFINPAYPQGEALTILQSIRFSYQFLMNMVDLKNTDPKIRFAKLIDYLNTNQPLVPLFEAMFHPDPCHQQKPNHCFNTTHFRDWVYCYFERLGQLIVLESGEGPQLPFEGDLFGAADKFVGTLRKDGTIVDSSGKLIIGYVNVSTVASADRPIGSAGPVVTPEGAPFLEQFGLSSLTGKFKVPPGSFHLTSEWLYWGEWEPVSWLPARDTCDLDQVRLKHLDGSALLPAEYDRIQRFIRLWHKLGWTIDETDHALIGLHVPAGLEAGEEKLLPGECNFVGYDTFDDKCSPAVNVGSGECSDGNGSEGRNCPDITTTPKDISPGFLHQLVAVQKLLDLTGLPLDKLLSFWSDIGTAGEKSLYSRLFLTHNLLGIDKILKSDSNGNYLTKPAKLSEHMPVLLAALKMKSNDFAGIMTSRQLADALTLANLSVLYRYSLLAKILHIPVLNVTEVIVLLGDPFRSAQHTLALLQDWGNMEDAGFTFSQLNYLIRGQDDPRKPLAPARKTILQISKTLYDGLNAIDHDHPDVSAEKRDEANADLVRAKSGLLFESSVVEQIVGLFEGTTVYTTNAPADSTIQIPDGLKKKLKYNNQEGATPPNASIQLTGILTEDEKAKAKALSNNPQWSRAIDRARKQALNVFTDALFGIFADKDEAIATLLAGDINLPSDPKNPNATDGNTAPAKCFYFLRHFLPFLRQRLAHRLIVNTLSGASGLTIEVTDVLLSEVLVGSGRDPAINILEQIHQQPDPTVKDWKGFLISPVDDVYTFVATSLVDDNQPPALVIDGRSIPFKIQQGDPSNVWSTDPESPIRLKGGQLYSLEVQGQSAAALRWKTSTSPKALIPASALLPDFSSTGTEEVFIKLYKAALLVKGFGLTADEVSYWQEHGSDFKDDFNNFDFNAVTLGHWRRLQAYASLRDKLPKSKTNLLGLFEWAGKPGDAAKLSAKISEATLWNQRDVEKLIAPEHFDLNRREAFRNEINLVKLQKALSVAGVIDTDINRLFDWTNPVSRFSVCHQVAEDIRAAFRSRYELEDWEQVVKPLNDQLRENQKQALISHLLVQKDLIEWGVIDADSLFEFFLIDVQMDACMETSRIKQAISSVQLFVQRCLLGLEDRTRNLKQIGVPVDALDRDRWEWMQHYRVWEANRKIFLYPENWIKSELRDDKSPFYRELESEMLQKDINKQMVEDALKSYLFKVDEVANLKVVGLFLEQEQGTDGKLVDIKLHVFARTRNAPYFFYYRYFDKTERNWYPWETMQVDVPSYDEEDVEGKITINGTFLTPVVWNKRLLVFFPQVFKKTIAPPDGNKIPTNKDSNGNVVVTKPTEVWEIKMGWSERRNAKWTQKQISTGALYSTAEPRPIHLFSIVPRFSPTNQRVVVSVQAVGELVGEFEFSGSQLHLSNSTSSVTKTITPSFHYLKADDGTPVIHSLQAKDDGGLPLLFDKSPFFADLTTRVAATVDTVSVPFSHAFSHELLGKLGAGNLDDLFDYYLEKVSDKDDAFGRDGKAIYNELKRPYSLYNWEAAFHTPMLLVDRLLAAQQFDQALKMCHYVLNPYEKGIGNNRFWKFPPFKEVISDNVLEKLFLELQPNQPDDSVNEWRNKPFQPHVVARSRPSAYMKWVAMKYIEILIAYGDYHFRQNTLEAIPLAIQCYVLASHVYGPRGQEIPKRGKILPQTYNSLLDKWDAFSNAMVELELVFPFSNQTPLPVGTSKGAVGLANVFGFASTLYFCIPDNPQLRALRDTIDDRLFKIRHCQDIEGVVRHLPLFEPPIDPALLVQAAAQGLSVSSVLNDLNAPMPNYRFYYLLQKALELCSELKALSNAFLAAKEKGDAEALSQLRARHESSIHNVVIEVKKKQLDEAGKALAALQQSRKVSVYRLQHYLKLMGEDLGKVPDSNTDFGELPDLLEELIDESGLKLTRYEKEEMDKAAEANDLQENVGRIETLAGILHAIPTIGAFATPIGVGANFTLGGSNFGSAAQATGRAAQVVVGNRTFSAANAGRKAGFLRQLQDRVQQANVAGYEITNIDKQALTQQIRIEIANQEIINQQKQIDNAQEMEEFLRNKYTNQELYSWMAGQLSSLHYQAYTLAYDLAKRAEKVFRFDRGLTTSNFIQFGNWDIAHDGLLAGERLYVGLKQLEAAYQEKRGHDFEVSKSISLRQINPLELIRLKETGVCEFTLPEVLFDMDYPGHYLRRIRSVSLRIPCVLGTHTSLNCTLRLLEHKFRTSAIVKDKNDYLERLDETDERFSTINVPITSIAVSSLEDENGVFELNFHDERYLPFEGAGAVSKWRIELPAEFRQFDYDTIADVVIRLRYTSVDGGDKLKKPASSSVMDYIKSAEDLSREEGLFAAFDLKNDFPNEWYSANHPATGATTRVLTIDKLNEKLPIFTKGRLPANIKATDIYLFASGTLNASSITGMQGGNEITFTEGQSLGNGLPGPTGMKSFVAQVDSAMDSLQLTIHDTNTTIEKMWLVERYVLN
jgi:hypothetical protein